MKILKIVGVSAITLASLQALSASASWLDGSPYVGGGAGYTVYDGVDDLTDSEDPVDRSRTTKNAFGFIGFAGWRFPGNYSLELSYANFGEFEIEETVFIAQNEVENTDYTGEITAKGIGMRYDWSGSESMNVYGRIGVMRWEAAWDSDFTYTLDNSVLDRTRSSSDTNGSEFYVGVGGQYELIKNIYGYVEAFYLDSRFDQDGFNTKQPVYAVFGGLMIRFGDVARPSGTTDKRTRELTACDPKYKDIGGVMCE